MFALDESSTAHVTTPAARTGGSPTTRGHSSKRSQTKAGPFIHYPERTDNSAQREPTRRHDQPILRPDASQERAHLNDRSGQLKSNSRTAQCVRTNRRLSTHSLNESQRLSYLETPNRHRERTRHTRKRSERLLPAYGSSHSEDQLRTRLDPKSASMNSRLRIRRSSSEHHE